MLYRFHTIDRFVARSRRTGARLCWPWRAVLGLLVASSGTLAIDPPHTADCTDCHMVHNAPGGSITAIAGNANLCLSCHVSGGAASARPFANADQTRAWPGLASNVLPGGNSHRWDAGPAGYVQVLGGATVASSGRVSSAGAFTGVYAKTYTITITTNGNVGVARFNWSATAPGGGAGTNLLTAATVALNEGISARFFNSSNGVAFRSNDAWRIVVRSDLRFPTNAALAARMTDGFMFCSTCHDEHTQMNTPFDTNAPAYTGPGTGAGRHFLQMDNDQDQMCADCHRARAVTNVMQGSHPVGMTVVTGAAYRLPGAAIPLERATRKVRCETCHQVHFAPARDGTLLRLTNNVALCTSCHTLANTASPAGHFSPTNNFTLWPGGQYGSLFPARSNLVDRGACANCHTPHGWPDAANPTNHYPMLLADREENLCYTCHDANGPAHTDVRSVFLKASKHPVASTGRHTSFEDGAPGAFGVTNRHAECMDCHNPHQARSGYAANGAANRMLGVSRLVVTNGVAGSAPKYGFVPFTDMTTPFADYQVCFKCHSGWTTLPTGSKDLGIVFNPTNQSMHPVEGPGRNTSSYMIASLTNGTGFPRLTVTSVVTCADCHNNNSIPLTVSLVNTYTGTVVRGPHGSVSNALMNGKLLRANYKMTSSGTYSAANFALCYICHSPSPFATTSESTRNDTRFNWHGRHMVDFGAACVDCHYDSHGTKLALKAANTNYARLVSFGPAVTGAGTWTTNATGGSCNLTCHGENHNPETYP